MFLFYFETSIRIILRVFRFPPLVKLTTTI